MACASCAPPPLPEVSDEPFTAEEGACEPSLDPAQFTACSTGSGIFGQWVLDERGLGGAGRLARGSAVAWATG